MEFFLTHKEDKPLQVNPISFYTSTFYMGNFKYYRA
jgi:hypothetical protein